MNELDSEKTGQFIRDAKGTVKTVTILDKIQPDQATSAKETKHTSNPLVQNSQLLDSKIDNFVDYYTVGEKAGREEKALKYLEYIEQQVVNFVRHLEDTGSVQSFNFSEALTGLKEKIEEVAKFSQNKGAQYLESLEQLHSLFSSIQSHRFEKDIFRFAEASLSSIMEKIAHHKNELQQAITDRDIVDTEVRTPLSDGETDIKKRIEEFDKDDEMSLDDLLGN